MSLVTDHKRANILTNEPGTPVRSVRSGEKDKLTHYVKPMLATLQDTAFDDADWIFEIKWDGYRAVAEVSKGKVKLYSRNGLSFLRLYPEIAQALTAIDDDVILDGEIIVLNQHNKPEFQKLQQYDGNRHLPIVYYVFDCLSYRGKSLMKLPLIERKEIARKVLPKSAILRYSDHVSESGVEFFEKMVAMNLEGMIAKRASSTYTPGKRSTDWLKIKHQNTQEAIIAGYTAPRQSRQYFGALVLAIRKRGKLVYIGHTGTGFTQQMLKSLHQKLQPLVRPSSPFDIKIPVNAPVTWVEPELVCQVKFTEITEEGILRHPVFMGLRIDKPASETTTLDKPAVKKSTEKTAKEKKAPKKIAAKSEVITINRHKVTITNASKVYWPDEKITKGDVIQYYSAVHRYILPYLKNRPQSLRRNPNGITDEGFFQKDAGDHVPSWIKTASLRAESVNRTIDYIICNNLETLLYMNNLGCIEINPWNSRITKPDYPDYLVLDIDPSEKNSFDQVIDTALAIKEVLDRAGAPAFCKTSGATGLHIYVPLHARYTYEQVRLFAEAVALLTEEKLPRITTTERALDKRRGRIYLDHLQNKKGQTLASVYSLRPKPGATVSAPLKWKEVKPGLQPSQFSIGNMIKRLEKTGDLFAGVRHEKINLQQCLKNLSL